MHAFGRTLRRAGDLRLLARPVGAGRERYCVAAGESTLATFAAVGPAVAFFEALRAGGVETARPPQDGPGQVTSPAASRGRPSRGTSRPRRP